MGLMSRAKGKTGEREVAALLRDLLGLDIRRRVRQHDGDWDLEGVPGWTLEVKRRATARRGEIASWWQQAVEQAQDAGQLPVLLYRADRDGWRAVWPLSVHLTMQRADMWTAYAWTVEGSLDAWAAVVREMACPPFLPRRLGPPNLERTAP